MDWLWLHVAVGYCLGRTLVGLFSIVIEEVADMIQAKRSVRVPPR